MENTKSKSVAVMSDFFIDRILTLKSKEQLLNSLTEKANVGGGSIRDIHTREVKGGNAVNVAYCLAKLGLQVTLFTVADKIGAAVLKELFSEFEKVSLKIANGKQGLTTVIEFPDEKGINVNVMIADVGDNRSFGPDKIKSLDEQKIINKADSVVVVNWATNIQGTELVEYVFANSAETALRFLDPADMSTRKEDFKNLLDRHGQKISVLSLNENECNLLADAYKIGTLLPKGNYTPTDVKNAAKKIAITTGLKNVDLHTRIGSTWSNGKESSFAPAYECIVKTVTGAGDSWDSADIIGYLSNFDVNYRLRFANAYASLYLSSEELEPPTGKQVLKFLGNV